MAVINTLTDWEAALLPTASPRLPRTAATQLAGPAYYVRRATDAGIAFATARDDASVHPRYSDQMTRWGYASVWNALTGT